MSKGTPYSILEALIFDHRWLVIGVFAIITLLMSWSSFDLRIDAGFNKHLPLNHPYMETFVEHQEDFGGADRIIVAIMSREKDIFSAAFFDALRAATDEVFFLPGVNRSSVKSLFTPNVRFTEVVAGGIQAGNVIPADFRPDDEGLAQVRDNILKAGILGRLVANDFSGAIISAELLQVDPTTGDRVDYAKISRALEENARDRFPDFDVHIIGFAKMVSDVREGAHQVIVFFLVAFFITAALIYLYTSHLRITLAILTCSLFAVVWQLGLLPLLGFGIDPMSILVPFLVFAIAVSHGMQMVSGIRAEVFLGNNFEQAARKAFKRLLTPGVVALASDTIGFVTIMLIDIAVIREVAIAASVGVAVIVFTNLVLLPVLVSFLKDDQRYAERLEARAHSMRTLWRFLALSATRKGSIIVLLGASGLLVVGLIKGTDVAVGDLNPGAPELRPDSRYNRDTAVITDKFSIGVDVMTVYAQSAPEGCIDYLTMASIDDFAWRMRNVEGVQSVLALPEVAKIINGGWNEGSLKWRVLPRNQHALVQGTSAIDTSTGLLNADCSVIPIYLFTEDHKAETIERVVQAVKDYQREFGSESVGFHLAGSIVGVMAATNETVRSAQFPMLAYIFAAIVILCVASFRSLPGTLCVILPLALVSLLAYALMNALDIGLKVSTLPVVALGVGIGVDYGIYMFSRFQSLLKEGYSIAEGYFVTLSITGFGVMCTGGALAIGVGTWIFSPLQFQADMGILLTFMFLTNMLGAIVLLPALAAWLLRGQQNANKGKVS